MLYQSNTSSLPVIFSSPAPHRIRSSDLRTLVNSAHPEQSKKLALVVDDVPDLTDLISMALKVAGYNVISMYSAQSALEVAKDEHFDLVISDIGMPGMSGYELAQQLRTLPGYESIPMIAITGFTQYSDRNKALEVGFNEHLKKPIDPLKLIELVKGFA